MLKARSALGSNDHPIKTNTTNTEFELKKSEKNKKEVKGEIEDATGSSPFASVL